MSDIKVVSIKTGVEQVLPEKDAALHMKLHARKFINKGPVEDFTPEEATSTTSSRKKAIAQGPTAPTENEASAQ
jgi:hypothetical protein